MQQRVILAFASTLERMLFRYLNPTRRFQGKALWCHPQQVALMRTLVMQSSEILRMAQVVVAEGAPDYGGHRLARALAEAGIESTAIADSAIFAMMARVNKVLHSPAMRSAFS